MADYRTHVTVSGVLGAAYGFSASLGAGFSPVQGALAGVLTGVAGMLPDLDSDTGRPSREVFGLLAAVAPLVLLNRLEGWTGGREPALLLAVLLYIAIRHGVSTLLHLVCVHRGMFHSIPALCIAGEVTFLAYLAESPTVRGLMALGVAIGFASHLVLDEIYSVRWNGAKIELKASAGSAVKFIGKSWPANIVAYGLALTLGYAVLLDGRGVARPSAGVDPNDRGSNRRPHPGDGFGQRTNEYLLDDSQDSTWKSADHSADVAENAISDTSDPSQSDNGRDPGAFRSTRDAVADREPQPDGDSEPQTQAHAETAAPRSAGRRTNLPKPAATSPRQRPAALDEDALPREALRRERGLR